MQAALQGYLSDNPPIIIAIDFDYLYLDKTRLEAGHEWNRIEELIEKSLHPLPVPPETNQILLPINNGAKHFVFLKMTVDENGQVELSLEDSMAREKTGDEHQANNQAILNKVAALIKEKLGPGNEGKLKEPSLRYTGAQGDAATCPFYAVQAAIKASTKEPVEKEKVLPSEVSIRDFQLAMTKKVARINKKMPEEEINGLEIDDFGILHKNPITEAYETYINNLLDTDSLKNMASASAAAQPAEVKEELPIQTATEIEIKEEPEVQAAQAALEAQPAQEVQPTQEPQPAQAQPTPEPQATPEPQPDPSPCVVTVASDNEQLHSRNRRANRPSQTLANTPEQELAIGESRTNEYRARPASDNPLLRERTFENCTVKQTCLSPGKETRLEITTPITFPKDNKNPNFNSFLFDFIHQIVQPIIDSQGGEKAGRKHLIRLNDAQTATHEFSAAELAMIQYCHFKGYSCQNAQGENLDIKGILEKNSMEVDQSSPYAQAFYQFIGGKNGQETELKNKTEQEAEQETEQHPASPHP